MMGEKPSTCSSAYLIQELRTYISMKTGQAAWGTHQANIQSNLLKTLSGHNRRQAMPAVDRRERKDDKEKKDSRDKSDRKHGKSESARHEARQRSSDGRRRDKPRDHKDSGRDRRRDSSRGRERSRGDKRERKPDRSSSSRGDRSSGGRKQSRSRSKSFRTAMPATPKQSGTKPPCYRQYMYKKDQSEGGKMNYPKCVFGNGCKFCHKSDPDKTLMKKWEESPPLDHERLMNPPTLVAAPAREKKTGKRFVKNNRKPSASSGSNRSSSGSRTSRTTSSASGTSTSQSSRSYRGRGRGRHSPARGNDDGKKKDRKRSDSRSKKRGKE